MLSNIASENYNVNIFSKNDFNFSKHAARALK